MLKFFKNHETVKERKRQEILQATFEQQKADMEYLAMMTGVELEQESEAIPDDEI